jgi:hypothetical protein
MSKKYKKESIAQFPATRKESVTKFPVTQIDSVYKHGERAFVFFVWMPDGGAISYGSRLALEGIVKSIKTAHKQAAVFVCVNDDRRRGRVVSKVYYFDAWWDVGYVEVETMMERFTKWVDTLGNWDVGKTMDGRIPVTKNWWAF